MPTEVDSRIPLQAGQPANVGPDFSKIITGQQLAEKLRGQQQVTQGYNALGALYGNPENVDARGNLKPEAWQQLMSVAPAVGLEVQSNQLQNAQRAATTAVNAYKVKEEQQQAVLRKWAPLATAYQNALVTTGGDKEKANALLQPEHTKLKEQCASSGDFSAICNDIPPDFNGDRLINNLRGVKGTIEHMDKAPAEARAAKADTRADQASVIDLAKANRDAAKSDTILDVVGEDGTVTKGVPVKAGGATGYMDLTDNPVKFVPGSVRKMGTKDPDAAGKVDYVGDVKNDDGTIRQGVPLTRDAGVWKDDEGKPVKVVEKTVHKMGTKDPGVSTDKQLYRGQRIGDPTPILLERGPGGKGFVAQADGKPVDGIDEKSIMPVTGALGGAATITEGDADRIADQFLTGDRQAVSGYARNPANMGMIQAAITRRAQDRGMSGADIAAKSAEFSGIVAGERALGTRQANLGTAIQEAKMFAPMAIDASAKVDRTRFPTINSIIMAVERGTGGELGEKLTQFTVANRSLASVYSQVLRRGGMPTDQSDREANKMLDQAYADNVYKATVQQILREAEGALKAPGLVRDELRETITGKPGAHPAPVAGAPATSTVTPRGQPVDIGTVMVGGEPHHYEGGKLVPGASTSTPTPGGGATAPIPPPVPAKPSAGARDASGIPTYASEEEFKANPPTGMWRRPDDPPGKVRSPPTGGR